MPAASDLREVASEFKKLTPRERFSVIMLAAAMTGETHVDIPHDPDPGQLARTVALYGEVLKAGVKVDRQDDRYRLSWA